MMNTVVTKLPSVQPALAEPAKPVYKISGMGWLCRMNVDGNWIPLFKLTPEQILDCELK